MDGDLHDVLRERRIAKGGGDQIPGQHAVGSIGIGRGVIGEVILERRRAVPHQRQYGPVVRDVAGLQQRQQGGERQQGRQQQRQPTQQGQAPSGHHAVSIRIRIVLAIPHSSHIRSLRETLMRIRMPPIAGATPSPQRDVLNSPGSGARKSADSANAGSITLAAIDVRIAAFNSRTAGHPALSPPRRCVVRAGRCVVRAGRAGAGARGRGRPGCRRSPPAAGLRSCPSRPVERRWCGPGA